MKLWELLEKTLFENANASGDIRICDLCFDVFIFIPILNYDTYESSVMLFWSHNGAFF